MKRALLTTACILALTFATTEPGTAKTFRFSFQSDAMSMDPYITSETFTLNFLGQIYESLVRRDEKLQIEPSLATKWELREPTVWRFYLRRDVTFADGAPFTAGDVIFSLHRVRGEGSQLKARVQGIKEIRKVDDHTIDVVTNGPNPILLSEIVDFYIMNKEWTEKNDASQPADLKKKEENYATRHANGTGPFMLKSREADVRTVLVANPKWWDKAEHNITEVVFTPIGSPATLVAALLSGQVDMIFPVPLQDVDRIQRNAGTGVLMGTDNRVIYLGMDQKRDELLYSSVKGKNPLKDVRVRKAMNMALDADAINQKIMRGAARPMGFLLAVGNTGFDAGLNKRLRYDPEGAKRLLAEAGYANGFQITVDCPNDRYVNDEKICLAVTGMLARVGIDAKLNAMTKAKYFPKLLNRDTSMYLFGWEAATYDAYNTLFELFHTPNQKGGGQWNIGEYSNPKIDDLIARIATEVNFAKRNALIREAVTILTEGNAVLPLHQQVLAWGIRGGVEVVQRADNRIDLRHVKVK
jgi:peptide/nickel transport system substrate-binding protein